MVIDAVAGIPNHGVNFNDGWYSHCRKIWNGWRITRAMKNLQSARLGRAGMTLPHVMERLWKVPSGKAF